MDVGEERGHNCPTQSTMMMITTVALYGSKQSGSSTRLQPVGSQDSGWWQVSSNVVKESLEVCLSTQAAFSGWRYPHPVGCWWLGPGVWLQGAGGELIARQVEPRVMEERGGGFNFCGKCLIETSGACTLGEVLSSTANSPS